MALSFKTNDPEALLIAVKNLIHDYAIDTWTFDKNGDFTLNKSKWTDNAWLRPAIEPGSLNFYFLANKDYPTTQEMFALFHTQLVHAVTSTCPDKFSFAIVTANKSIHDVLTP